MKIESIKKDKSKYKIIIDGEVLKTYEDIILEFNLLYKKEIDINEYKEILSRTEYYDVYDRVVKLLLKGRKSEKQIRDYLEKFNIKNKDKESIIEKLKHIKLIDDLAFTRAFINDKLLINKWGINKIKLELINNDIDYNIIEQEIKNIDNDILNNNIERLIVKKINSNHRYSNYQLKNKILNELINLGYKKECIIESLDRNLNDDSDILIKEYNRLLKRLEKKYDGEELEYRIKQKLLQKGYSKDKINSLIKEEN